MLPFVRLIIITSFCIRCCCCNAAPNVDRCNYDGLFDGKQCKCLDKIATGLLCENAVNHCVSNPCENDGNCSSTPGGYYCVCVAPFQGQRCQYKDKPPHKLAAVIGLFYDHVIAKDAPQNWLIALHQLGDAVQELEIETPDYYPFNFMLNEATNGGDVQMLWTENLRTIASKMRLQKFHQVPELAAYYAIVPNRTVVSATQSYFQFRIVEHLDERDEVFSWQFLYNSYVNEPGKHCSPVIECNQWYVSVDIIAKE